MNTMELEAERDLIRVVRLLRNEGWNDEKILELVHTCMKKQSEPEHESWKTLLFGNE